MGVLGKSNDSIISGAIICRGLDFKPVMDVAPDCELPFRSTSTSPCDSPFGQDDTGLMHDAIGESYAYKKIDLSNEEDKKFFEAAMAWDLVIDGKEWVDGKNFK